MSLRRSLNEKVRACLTCSRANPSPNGGKATIMDTIPSLLSLVALILIGVLLLDPSEN